MFFLGTCRELWKQLAAIFGNLVSAPAELSKAVQPGSKRARRRHDVGVGWSVMRDLSLRRRTGPR